MTRPTLMNQHPF